MLMRIGRGGQAEDAGGQQESADEARPAQEAFTDPFTWSIGEEVEVTGAARSERGKGAGGSKGRRPRSSGVASDGHRLPSLRQIQEVRTRGLLQRPMDNGPA